MCSFLFLNLIDISQKINQNHFLYFVKILWYLMEALLSIKTCDVLKLDKPNDVF